MHPVPKNHVDAQCWRIDAGPGGSCRVRLVGSDQSRRQSVQVRSTWNEHRVRFARLLQTLDNECGGGHDEKVRRDADVSRAVNVVVLFCSYLIF